MGSWSVSFAVSLLKVLIIQKAPPRTQHPADGGQGQARAQGADNSIIAPLASGS